MQKTQIKSFEQLPQTLLCLSCLYIPHKPYQCSKYCKGIYCLRCAVEQKIQNKNCKQCRRLIEIYPISGIPLLIYSNYEIQCQNCKIYCSVLDYQKHSIRCFYSKEIGQFSWKQFYNHITDLNSNYLQQMNIFLQSSKLSEDQIIKFYEIKLLCKCNLCFDIFQLQNHFSQCSKIIVFCDQCQWNGTRNQFQNHKQTCLQEQIQNYTIKENLLTITLNQCDLQLQQQEVENHKLQHLNSTIFLRSLFFQRLDSSTYHCESEQMQIIQDQHF